MNIQRLKFAWARGARLEVQIKPDFDRGNAWSREYNCPRTVADMNLYRYNWRIHPKDEHLQYGPISTALRLAVIEGYDVVSMTGHQVGLGMANCLWYHMTWEHTASTSSPEEFSMARLFMAELLADEGL